MVMVAMKTMAMKMMAKVMVAMAPASRGPSAASVGVGATRPPCPYLGRRVVLVEQEWAREVEARGRGGRVEVGRSGQLASLEEALGRQGGAEHGRRVGRRP